MNATVPDTAANVIDVVNPRLPAFLRSVSIVSTSGWLIEGVPFVFRNPQTVGEDDTVASSDLSETMIPFPLSLRKLDMARL
jgi:hypothetical protein